MCAVSLALTALGLLLLALTRGHPGVPVFEQCVEEIVIAIGFSTVGAIVAPRFPSRNYIGWLFCSIGLVAGVLLFCGEYAAYSLLMRPGSLPGGEMMAWIVAWLWVPHVVLFAFLGLLFPDGRLPTPRWRPFAWFIGVAVVVGAVAVAFSPGPIRGLEVISNPFSIEGAPGVSGPVDVLMFSLTLAAAASLLARLRGACDVERQQIKWFAYAATVAAVGALTSWVISDALDAWWLHWEVGFVGTVVGLAGLPVALGIAVLRYRLHEIDLIINLTLVYGILTATLAGVFEVTLVALQHVLLVFAHQGQPSRHDGQPVPRQGIARGHAPVVDSPPDTSLVNVGSQKQTSAREDDEWHARASRGTSPQKPSSSIWNPLMVGHRSPSVGLRWFPVPCCSTSSPTPRPTTPARWRK